MSSYVPSHKHAHPVLPPSQPPTGERPLQLRIPVPPTRGSAATHHGWAHGLGRPSAWALAVAALLVGLIAGLVLSSTVAASGAAPLAPIDTIGTALSALWTGLAALRT